MMGTAALTKKRMGYTNTKLHGIMAWAGMMLSAGGFYVIYVNKNQMGKDHFTTLHSWGEIKRRTVRCSNFDVVVLLLIVSLSTLPN